MAKRIVRDRCCGVLIDVQGFFLAQLDSVTRSNVTMNTANLVRLLGHFGIPMVATLERPVQHKGPLPQDISALLSETTKTFEKDFFDLCKERPIREHLAGLKKKQVIVAGCETDVCVLQSCLGLLDLGYEVFVVEELLFSSTHNVASAIARMKAEGAVLLTYKTLYYELAEAVESSSHASQFGALPDDLPDLALE